MSLKRISVSPGLTLLPLFDFFFWLLATVVAAWLRFDFHPPTEALQQSLIIAGALGVCAVVAAFFLRLYRGRHSVGSFREIWTLALVTLVAGTVGGSSTIIFAEALEVPRSLVFLAAPIQFCLAGSLRVIARVVLRRKKIRVAGRKRAIVYGTGAVAETWVSALVSDPSLGIEPLGLVSDAAKPRDTWMLGLPVYGSQTELRTTLGRHRPDVLLVAVDSATSELLAELDAVAYETGVRVLLAPGPDEVFGDGTVLESPRELNVEDLIGRKRLELDFSPVERFLSGKTVLVTGAGGSVGGELVNQLSRCKMKTLVLADRDETNMLAASDAVSRRAPELQVVCHLIDIRDQEAVEALFLEYDVDVVLHAAALKHVNLLEQFPEEAWKTNVVGTNNLLRASSRAGVSHFTNVSTDKAADPANQLGRTKAKAEALTSWYSEASNKNYCSVRFGNVVGSRGSLIPRVMEQIRDGGPVLLTSRDATRYFMAVSEAAQLILHALLLDHRGAIYVLDMGAPLKISEVIERIIRLSRRNILVKEIGLRPGEKSEESLFSASEELLESGHPSIMRVAGQPISPEDLGLGKNFTTGH